MTLRVGVNFVYCLSEPTFFIIFPSLHNRVLSKYFDLRLAQAKGAKQHLACLMFVGGEWPLHVWVKGSFLLVVEFP